MQRTCTHKQPNAGYCFVCGTENPHGLGLTFYDDGGQMVETFFTLKKEYEGYPGIAHGGILATILDEVVGRVAMIDDHHRFMMTVILKVQYRNPVPTETPLQAIGEIVKLKGRLAKAQGRILLPDGKVGCEAELTLADMPASIASDNTVSRLNWRVIPD